MNLSFFQCILVVLQSNAIFLSNLRPAANEIPFYPGKQYSQKYRFLALRIRNSLNIYARGMADSWKAERFKTALCEIEKTEDWKYSLGNKNECSGEHAGICGYNAADATRSKFFTRAHQRWQWWYWPRWQDASSPKFFLGHRHACPYHKGKNRFVSSYIVVDCGYGRFCRSSLTPRPTCRPTLQCPNIVCR